MAGDRLVGAIAFSKVRDVVEKNHVPKTMIENFCRLGFQNDVDENIGKPRRIEGRDNQPGTSSLVGLA